MARLSEANVLIAREIIGRYPRPKSALIPLLHLAQEQDGHVTTDAMAHLAELVGITPSEVYGTASFYEMFKFEPVGRYCVTVCTNISCQLLGAWELLEHAEERLGIKAGGTTDDGLFTLEDVECIAACTEAPALQVNYRFRYKVTPRRLRPAGRRPARPAAWPTRSRPTARWPGCARRWPPTAGPAPAPRPRPRWTPDERAQRANAERRAASDRRTSAASAMAGERRASERAASARSTCRAWCRPGRPS